MNEDFLEGKYDGGFGYADDYLREVEYEEEQVIEEALENKPIKNAPGPAFWKVPEYENQYEIDVTEFCDLRSLYNGECHYIDQSCSEDEEQKTVDLEDELIMNQSIESS